MGAGVTWSHHAQREANEIRAYIEQDSKANAVHVVGQFLDAADRLVEYPLSGPVIERWSNPALRELIVGSYRVMYSVEHEEIIVFSVRHVRRRLPKRFRREWLR